MQTVSNQLVARRLIFTTSVHKLNIVLEILATEFENQEGNISSWCFQSTFRKPAQLTM